MISQIDIEYFERNVRYFLFFEKVLKSKTDGWMWAKQDQYP